MMAIERVRRLARSIHNFDKREHRIFLGPPTSADDISEWLDVAVILDLVGVAPRRPQTRSTTCRHA
jgi:hypothetical protein